ncbi:MAG: DNA polymerase III subunit gamma/tau [Clostridia bacterium]|nr:DNA polymerase III subunit gamma/tau [Clostridia bacterium]
MAYQALYRQWRPLTFSQMVGQENIRQTLKNQVTSGRIAHAYLFCGSRGTGKTSTAKILSRAINCEHPLDGDPCGECESCRRLLENDSLDVQEIDAASNNGVDQVRELRETIQYPPQFHRYKVYIIDEVHMLSLAAFNALLKTLEEPPAHAVFILATTEPQKLPATILSRCQRFDFSRIPAKLIQGRLREAVDGAGAQATDDALQMIARAAEGGMRDALSILDMCLGYGQNVDAELVHQVLGTADRGFLFRFSDALSRKNISETMMMIDELMRAGREPIVFSRSIAQHLRSLQMAVYCEKDLADLLEITAEDAQEYIEQAKQFPPSSLMHMMDIFMDVETSLRYATSPRIALENATVRACTGSSTQQGTGTSQEGQEDLAEKVRDLERKLDDIQRRLQDGANVRQRSRAAESRGAQEMPSATVQRVVSGDEQAVWKAAMDFIKKTEAGKFGMLLQGKFVGCEGDCYLWESSYESYIRILGGEAFRTIMDQALSEAAGKPCTFRAVLPGEKVQPSAKQAKEEDPGLGDLIDAFGRENVVVQE